MDAFAHGLSGPENQEVTPILFICKIPLSPSQPCWQLPVSNPTVRKYLVWVCWAPATSFLSPQYPSASCCGDLVCPFSPRGSKNGCLNLGRDKGFDEWTSNTLWISLSGGYLLSCHYRVLKISICLKITVLSFQSCFLIELIEQKSAIKIHVHVTT